MLLVIFIVLSNDRTFVLHVYKAVYNNLVEPAACALTLFKKF